MADCIEKRRLILIRDKALKTCRDCLQTLRDAVGTSHFRDFLPDAAEAHELLLEAQAQLDGHRTEHGC